MDYCRFISSAPREFHSSIQTVSGNFPGKNCPKKAYSIKRLKPFQSEFIARKLMLLIIRELFEQGKIPKNSISIELFKFIFLILIKKKI